MDDIEVREDQASVDTHTERRLEVATFTEGVYVESILIDRIRAKAIHADLGKLLGAGREICATGTMSLHQCSPRETAIIFAALRYWQREGVMRAGAEQDIAADGGRFCAPSTQEIGVLTEKVQHGLRPNRWLLTRRVVGGIT